MGARDLETPAPLIWAQLPPPKAVRRWASELARVRAEQGHHPDQWARVFYGAQSTCWHYVKALREGLEPNRKHPLNTAGYEFRVTPTSDYRGAIYARWAGDDRSRTLELTPAPAGAREDSPT